MINKKQQTLKELTSEVEVYFKNLSYTRTRILTYKRGWKLLNEFMLEHSFDFYDPMVGESFISSIVRDNSYEKLSRKKKDRIRCANVLTEYQTTGEIKFRSITKTYEFKGEIGKVILEYLDYRKSKGITKKTLGNYRLYLWRLLNHLNSKNIFNLSELNNDPIMEFINSLGFYTKATNHCTLSVLRGFLRYLFDKKHTEINYSYLVPKSSYKKEAHLPTTYTKEEIECLIQAVDQSSPKGKRDRAMILLAARLGLRASDICGIKFKNINWEKNTIILIQKKTDKRIELPLLIEVGNAIINYLKYGRPESKLPFIFLRAGQPYDRLKEPTLHSIVTFYLKRAGIENIEKKKHGPHALRHSLAGILLEKKTPLPVISEVLGHSSTESTKTYLRIDLKSLQQCALEVPPLNSSCYREVL
ncbi:MAG: tyrosine-type recombinase/integrase [Bacillota bacterium]